MKTFILAIFGLLALANAEEEFSIDQSEARKANPEPTKAHSDIKIEKPEKRLAKRDAAAYADPDVITRYASMGPVLAAYADPDVITRYARDLVEEEGDARRANPEHEKAYANPGIKNLRRLAKRDAVEPPLTIHDYQGRHRRSALAQAPRPYKVYDDVILKKFAEAHPFKLAEDVLTKRSAEARPFN